MLRRIPVVACPIYLDDLLCGVQVLSDSSALIRFNNCIAKLLNSRYVFFMNSATASIYTVLGILKEKSNRREVILPAYTASVIVNAIQQAGLKPVLCDVSLETFNIDLELLRELINPNTLVVLGVHMFGIGCGGLKELKERYEGVYVVEDCAQGFGSRVDGRMAGSIGDLSVFSFNRGKNIPAYGGGCIVTCDKDLSEALERKIKTIKDWPFYYNCFLFLKLFLLSIVTRPIIYGLLYPVIARLREQRPSDEIIIGKYTGLQAAVVISLLKRLGELSRKRNYNGMKLLDGLKEIGGIILPKIPQNSLPAFNRLPVIFRDLDKREKVEKLLSQAGLETSRMYFKPLHHVFDLGYKKEEFPNACYLAEHLLTLPVHPLVREEDLQRMINIIRDTDSRC